MGMATKLRKQLEFVIPENPPYWMTKPFNNRHDRKKLRKVYHFGYRAHAHEVRRDGYPYYSHSKALVRITIQEWQVFDLLVVIDELLHDTRERKITGGFPVTGEILRREFGDVVEIHNYALTRRGHDKKKKESKARYMERIIAQGWRTLLTKFADRVHNLRTLQYQPSEKWQRIYDESCEHYRPLIKTLEALLPTDLKPVAKRVERSLEQALRHAERLIQSQHLPLN